MKCLPIVFSALALLSLCCCEEEKKSKKIDIEEVLKNERLLNNYLTCLLEGKKCTPEGEELRKNAPEMTKTICAKCSEEQIDESTKLVKHLKEKKPDMLKKLFEKYDPEKLYTRKWVELFQKHGVDLSDVVEME